MPARRLRAIAGHRHRPTAHRHSSHHTHAHSSHRTSACAPRRAHPRPRSCASAPIPLPSFLFLSAFLCYNTCTYTPQHPLLPLHRPTPHIRHRSCSELFSSPRPPPLSLRTPHSTPAYTPPHSSCCLLQVCNTTPLLLLLCSSDCSPTASHARPEPRCSHLSTRPPGALWPHRTLHLHLRLSPGMV